MTTIYLTTAEAATRTGVKRGTVLTWIARGHLSGRKAGRDWRLRETDVYRCARQRNVGWPKGKSRKISVEITDELKHDLC